MIGSTEQRTLRESEQMEQEQEQEQGTEEEASCLCLIWRYQCFGYSLSISCLIARTGCAEEYGGSCVIGYYYLVWADKDGRDQSEAQSALGNCSREQVTMTNQTHYRSLRMDLLFIPCLRSDDQDFGRQRCFRLSQHLPTYLPAPAPAHAQPPLLLSFLHSLVPPAASPAALCPTFCAWCLSFYSRSY